jgi:RsiW-degrading membrane proteinase PrsW (M82 family)
VNVWVILIIALAPGLFWLWYFYKKDIYEPEPLSLLAKMFFLGMVATILAFALENLIGLLVSGILLAVIVAPIVEESLKFFMVKEFVYNNKEFDEPMDGIVYAAATALGFATLENLLYLFYQVSFSSLVVTGIIRAIIAVPGHAIFSLFWGYSLGIAKFRPPGKRSTIILGGFFLSIAVHVLYNFLLEGSYLGFAILLFIVIPCIWWFAEEKIRNVLLPEAVVLRENLKEKM